MGSSQSRSNAAAAHAVSSSVENEFGKLRGNKDEVIRLHTGAILGLDAFQDHLITCGDDNSVSITSIDFLLSSSGSAEPSLRKLTGHKKAVNRVISNAATNQIFTCSRDLSLRAWDISTLNCTLEIPNAHSLNIAAIAVQHNSPGILFSGSRDYSVKAWDLTTGQSIVEFSSPRNIVTAMTTAPQEPNLLYQGSEDLCVRVWDTRSSSTIPATHLTGYVYFPLCISRQSSDFMLATGCKGFNNVGCSVTIWDMRNTSAPIQERSGHSQDVTGCKFVKDKEWLLVTASKDGSIFACNVNEAQGIASYHFPKKLISSLTVLDGQSKETRIAVGAIDGSASILAFKEGEMDMDLIFASKSLEEDESTVDS